MARSSHKYSIDNDLDLRTPSYTLVTSATSGLSLSDIRGWLLNRVQQKLQYNSEVTYTSALRYNDTSKSSYREYDPTSPQYVGTPNKEIDKAWADLLSGQYLVLSEEEAQELEDPVAIRGFYLAEVEIMHSLHCLNAIRKALDPQYYSEYDEHPLPENLQRIHVEHCIEQLRQNIQCAGDLTPVPLRPFGEEPHKNLIGTPQVHTCRDWEIFRNWYTNRGLEHGKVNGGGT
ncbi:hypothetical protein DL98DRAFT_586552 [Cadophora sp. DSE1049]|nr:hypothetical protein DL98DRAFT_586552 [Cadophora sp. DSE1049]